MIIDYNVTGSERKRLVTVLSGVLGVSAEYQGAPSFAYAVGSCTVSREGVLTLPEQMMRELAERIVEKLREQGFTPASTEDNSLTIELPRSQFTADSIQRLEQIIAGKELLFKRAFQTDTLLLDKGPEKLRFPWFHLKGIDGEVEAYMQFISALGKMARKRRRITAKPYEGGNDKFTMRLFLVQLGFNGPKFKQTRKVLTMNLEGNTAWKNGAPQRGGGQQ